MESLLDNDTKIALENMGKPLRIKLANIQNKVSVTLIILEKLLIKVSGGK